MLTISDLFVTQMVWDSYLSRPTIQRQEPGNKDGSGLWNVLCTRGRVGSSPHCVCHSVGVLQTFKKRGGSWEEARGEINIVM